MPLIPVDVGGAKERKAVPNGRYDLTILSCEEGESRQQKKPQLIIFVSIDAHPDAPAIRTTLPLIAAGDPEKTAEFKKLLVARFLEAFKIPHGPQGYDTDDFPGSKATLEVKLGEANEAGDQYNEMVIPKMKGGESAVGAKPQVAKPPKR